VKNLSRALFIPAVVLCALSANVHAQSTKFNAIGSSALFLEFGEAAYSNAPTSCAWSTGTSGVVVATDTSTGSSLTDTGNAWVVWVPATGNTCATDATPAKVYGYLQTDSVVGNRCLFNAQASGGPFCSVSYSGGIGLAGAGKIEGASEVSLPASVANSLTNNKINAAGTDIRPEDAKFATARALTPCGSTAGGTGSIAPYLGLGYTNGSDIASFFSSSKFHVINFTLPSTVLVQPVGFDPIMVVVNSTDAVGTGFNNTGFTNISRAALAQYLDGSVGTTSAVMNGLTSAKPVTVMVREPLSGTYNTMEYNVPNTMAMMTSQDVGVLQPPGQVNCSGTVPASNPMAIENVVEGSWRYRTIGTGQELAETFATNDALGYGFWGVSNFAAAPATAKYVKVDGIDPIQIGYTGGVIPTTAAELAKVNFGNLSNGLYPIWSLLRVVTVDGTTAAIGKTLALAAANFSTTSHPDFLTYYTTKGTINVDLERSHFAPPGINFPSSGVNQPANHGTYGGSGNCTTAEAGGDVGGVPQRILADIDFCKDTGTTYGLINRRY
jgi:hypothetical protein